MLKNKWIITKKFPDKSMPDMSVYKIVPVDTDFAEESAGYSKCIRSKRKFDVGTYTDDELNPVAEQYRNKQTDVAVVEMTNKPIHDSDIVQVSLLGRRFGEFTLLFGAQDIPITMSRGDSVLVRREYIDFDKESPLFNILYNMTIKCKARHFPKSKHAFGDCDMAVITGIDTIDMIENTNKHVLAFSDKFGYISFMISETEPEFLTRISDRILIERYHDHNIDQIAYRILSNISIDGMRNAFLSKKR